MASIRIGSDYGGWWIPEDLIGPSSVCYLAGVGEDISFDVELLRRYQCTVVGIDPTPRASQWVRKHAPADYGFVAIGLGRKNGVARFYAPKNPAHVSHSMNPAWRSTSFFEAPIRTLGEVMKDRGDTHIDLLKLDVEGAQHDVIDGMLKDGIRPTCLCIEFDQPEPMRATRATVRRLKRAGYDLVHVESFNATFLRDWAHDSLRTEAV